MGTNDKYGLMRQIDMNEPVTITLPAHVWLGFTSAYNSTKWEAHGATAILMEVQDALFDPLWVKEQQAEAQRNHARTHDILSRMAPGFPGLCGDDGIPPDPSGLPLHADDDTPETPDADGFHSE